MFFQGVEDVGLAEVQAAAPSHDHLLHRDHTVPRLFGQPTQVYKHPILRILWKHCQGLVPTKPVESRKHLLMACCGILILKILQKFYISSLICTSKGCLLPMGLPLSHCPLKSLSWSNDSRR